MRARAVVIEAQRAGHGVCTQQLGLAAPQDLALGVGRQLLGVGHAHGDLPGGQQPRHHQVVGTANHQHHAWCLGAQAAEQGGEQGELDVIGEADAKHRLAGSRIEVGSAADRRGDGVQRGREQGEDFLCPWRRLHAAPGAHEQRVIEQRAQACQRRADGWLAEKQLLSSPGHTAFVHQRLEDDQQVQIEATQVVAVHPGTIRGDTGLVSTALQMRALPAQIVRAVRSGLKVAESLTGMKTIDRV